MRIFRRLSSIDRPYQKGSVREMLNIAFPMVVSQASYTVMTFIDRLFLSKLGSEHMNAAMLGGITVFMMLTFFIGITGYGTAVVAQYLGCGLKEKCPLVLTQSVIIVLFAYPVILLSRGLAYSLFNILGLDPGQLALQTIYFNILVFAAVIPLLSSSFSAFFSGIGKTRAVMFSSLTAMAVNILMNYLLIFGKFGFPALGIRGAAIGTIIGNILGLMVLFFYYINASNVRAFNIRRSLRLDTEVMKTLLRFGYPSGMEFFLNLMAFNLIVMIFHSAGSIAATASTIVFNWHMVSFVPLIGVQIGVISLVGRYMGSGSVETAQKSTMSGFRLGLIYSGFIFIFFFGFPETLARLFVPDTDSRVFFEALPATIYMIRIASFYVLSEAVFVVFIGALRGAGDTLWAMFISVSLHWVLVPVLFFMLKISDHSLESAWQVIVGLVLVFSILVYLRYKSGKWREIKMLAKSCPVPVLVDDVHV